MAVQLQAWPKFGETHRSGRNGHGALLALFVEPEVAAGEECHRVFDARVLHSKVCLRMGVSPARLIWLHGHIVVNRALELLGRKSYELNEHPGAAMCIPEDVSDAITAALQ
jgi:hypothetical protein